MSYGHVALAENTTSDLTTPAPIFRSVAQMSNTANRVVLGIPSALGPGEIQELILVAAPVDPGASNPFTGRNGSELAVLAGSLEGGQVISQAVSPVDAGTDKILSVEIGAGQLGKTFMYAAVLRDKT